jgi:hypothetical protein
MNLRGEQWLARAVACALMGVMMTAAGCGGDRIRQLPDAGSSATIRVDPPAAQVTVINGQPVAQAYTATLVQPDGAEQDVTSSAVFSLEEVRYGTFAGPMLTVSGQGAGPVRVTAVYQTLSGEAQLTVRVKDTIVDPDVPPDLPGVFDSAAEDPALAPEVVYPLDRILVPPNLGQFDVHWRQATANFFEVRMSNQYLDIRRYTNGDDPAQPYWMAFQPAQWYPIASSREQLTLRVTGMVAGAPAKKGTSTLQYVDVTNEDTQGGVYYWATTSPAGIWRYDIAKPTMPATPYFPDNQRPASCMGCHSLSRDGTKIALTLDGGNGRGTVFNVADRTPLIPFDGATQPALRWNFATFDAQGTRLVTVENGALTLRAINGALLAGPLPTTTPGARSTHPEISPDNKWLVNVEYASGSDWAATPGSLVVRSYDAAAGTFGAPTVRVASEPGAGNYYPSFSPDSEWIAFTRTASSSYDAPSARSWVVRRDGSQAPVVLAAANAAGELTTSWARWVPFEQTFGPPREKLFYLTFSSKRAFGVRMPNVGQPQIWMTAFSPQRAAQGLDPSGPAFRLPFQSLATANHIAQWTQAIVVQ